LCPQSARVSPILINSEAKPNKDETIDELVARVSSEAVERMQQIETDHAELEAILQSIDQVNNAIIQKHEADFISSYKDHMLKVQIELLQFKKRSSEFFNNMRKDEKLKMLEQSVKWLRDELVALSSNIDDVKASNKTLTDKLNLSEEENASLKTSVMSLTHHNVILKRTVQQLKSPALIAKYEQNGALKERHAQLKKLAHE